MALENIHKKSFDISKYFVFNPYKKPAHSTRNGAIFQVHPYPTKINYKSIVPFVLAHTKPGDTVYDCFSGTCSTGLAAASCAKRNPDVLNYLGTEAIQNAKWGQRKAICIDIGVLPTFIGRTLLNPVETTSLKNTFDGWMKNVEKEWGWIYETVDPNGKKGKIRYIYFSDVIQCNNCCNEIPFIEIFVDFDKGEFKNEARCPECGFILNAQNVEPVMEKIRDRLLKTDRLRVKRIPYQVYGQTDNRNWKRGATKEDLNDIRKIEKTALPRAVKPIPMLGEKRNGKWGEMYRSGYHRDVTHVHHFYTPRNLTAISILFNEAEGIPNRFRQIIILAISSYNIANSTLMTRFVFKNGSNLPVNTSAQPGALYIPNCPVEKNVFLGVRKKFRVILKALEEISRWTPTVEVKTRPAQKSGLKPNSVDYIFTDPPFGENIQYSELNFLSEAWLGSFTKDVHETIISTFQGKDVKDYGNLLAEAFKENFRILKPGRFMTVVFHNTRKEVWNALRTAILHSGFEILYTSILDKTQTSFKQTTTKGAVKKDPIILAYKPELAKNFPKEQNMLSSKEFIIHHLKKLKNRPSPERSFDYIFGRFVGHRLSNGNNIPVDAKEFRRIVSQVAKKKEDMWYLENDNRKGA